MKFGVTLRGRAGRLGLSLAFPALLFLACGRSPGFPAEFQTELGGSVLYCSSRDTAGGLLDFGKAPRRRSLEIRLEPPLALPPDVSLSLEYGLKPSPEGTPLPPPEGGELVLRCSGGLLPDDGAPSFVLPWDGTSFGFSAGEAGDSGSFRYEVPLTGNSLAALSITPVLNEGGGVPGAVKENAPVLEIRSLKIVPRWYGLERDRRGLSLTPFVFALPGGLGLELPAEFAIPRGELLIRSRGLVRLSVESLSLEGPPLEGEFRVIPGLFPSPLRRAAVEAEGLESLRLASSPPRLFPEPIPLDPALILDYPRSSWRREDYEVFRWEGFPSLLIFDTGSYAVQDRLFKRLAFFVEKAGWRGRLAGDEEIAGQHGWNAHDYRAQDLARFFDAARLASFPLLPEERELEAVLFDALIIRREGDGIVPGAGGIISISRESEGYLRGLFMAHEGFHGIFFIDEDFREFSRRRWENLEPAARRFIISYFDYQHYDIRDEYLMVNEFMAHVLQQPVSRAGRYFGETLASRIDASPWRRTVLPEKDESTGTWPALADLFIAEARAFDAYAAGRWGLGAGRVHRIRVRKDPA
ncbi:MAG: hypothetical protein LBB77_01800 [Treponema sp.]|nr:hypothetical protein [Treponema sp.]